MYVMTKGFQAIQEDKDIQSLVHFVIAYWDRNSEAIKKADMFVGRPSKNLNGLNVTYEDEGRTLVCAIRKDLPNVYACVNEVGGLTFMLSEEY